MLLLTLRNLFARKVRLVMSGLAIVIGVAFLSGVMVFSNGLSTTFDNIIYGSTPDGVVRAQDTDEFSSGVSGQSAQAMTPDVVSELEALPEVARADGDIIGGGLSLLGSDGTLVGGSGAPTLAFNYHDGPNMEGEQILLLGQGRWPEANDEIVLDQGAVDAGEYELGDEIKMLAPFGLLERTATLVGIAEFNGGGTAGATLLIFSTTGAQEIFFQGKELFNRVSLTAAEGVTQRQLADAAAKVIPEGFETATGDKVAEESQDAVGSFLDVIKTFLTVFAIIAVIVGGFIIVNTFTILIAQRSRELALLRAMGASRGQVTRSVLLEAFVLSLISSTLAIGLGLLLARGLASAFRSFGLDISGNALDLSSRATLISYAVGIGVTMAAAYLPARRAGKVAPVAAMRQDIAPERASLRRRTVIGSVVLLIGAGFAAAGVADTNALLIGIGAIIWILTVAAMSSILGWPVLAACRSLFSALFGTTGRLAGENALRDPRRTGATASALMIGLALVSTIGVLAASLNKSVDDVVDEQFTADLLVQSTTFLPFSTEVGDRIAGIDGVGVMARQQFTTAQHDDSTVYVTGVDEKFNEVYDLEVLEGSDRITGAETIISDDFATKYDVGVGDTLDLAFQGGKALAPTIVGIIEGSEVASEVTVPLDQITKAGVLRQDTAISILLAPGADAQEVHDLIDEAAESVPIVGVYDKEQFSDQIREQVNQLLYMIYGLLALAIVIAVIGIVNTLGLSVIERTREVGLLRAVGMSRTKLRRMITLESVAIAVLGAVLGMALGLVIGVLLQRALADELTSLGLPFGQLVVFLVIAVVVGVLAAVVPAIRAARLNVLAAIASE
ncbi:ABC transporter permease [Nocardioides sp. Root190]|uniref:ABC transporter permease n=1 Tax=Nocardioides sp. Root190 TaxID=1736488 RepID=UPI0006F63C9B|nr:FtsX-like permease family protein [Nocardioides sp. Root190]KRB73951.1 ABC transporter permease [Nocardioides sp. Root190]